MNSTVDDLLCRFVKELGRSQIESEDEVPRVPRHLRRIGQLCRLRKSVSCRSLQIQWPDGEFVPQESTEYHLSFVERVPHR